MGPSPEKLKALEEKMNRLGISKNDIEEKFIKAGGRGGQKVNKSNSAVFLRHRKTNISVKCQSSRSQHLNRFLALRLLVEKIEYAMDKSGKKKIEKQDKLDRIRKQKLRRKRKTKKKNAIRQNKHCQPENGVEKYPG